MIKLVKDDTKSALYFACKDEDTGAAIDLTGTTVKLRWTDSLGAAQEVAMTIQDAANGLVSVGLGSGILTAVMTMKFDVQITYPDTSVLTNNTAIKAKVRAHA